MKSKMDIGRQRAESFGVKEVMTHTAAIDLSFYASHEVHREILTLAVWNVLLTLAVVGLMVAR